MNFLELSKKRYSARSFSDKTVDDKEILMILEAGQAAPTACNYQPQMIYCINSKEGLTKLQNCKTSRFNETLAILVGYNKKQCWTRDYDNKKSGDIDASIVATHMMLQAEELGIKSTWIMHFDPNKIMEEFDLPAYFVPVCLLAMGYPSENCKPAALHFQRKELKETVFYL